MNPSDEFWMRRALALAEKGRGHVEPNPLVGAVVVRDGREVGAGWHQKYGAAHAEVNAFAQAGEAARGATLYVTLEPCCHHGKTPPCTDAVLRTGVQRVVAAMADPFPQVAGKGAAILRAAGIHIEFGLCATEARRLNAPYLKLLASGRPYVHAKWAMSLDGKIATRTGHSQWISNDASRRRVHELRGQMDGILVGIGTALADDPLLTARPAGPRTAVRVIVDSQARLPVGSRLVATAREVPLLIAVTGAAPPDRIAKLQACGVEVLTLPGDAAGKLSLTALLDELGRRRFTNVLVEGGGTLLGSLFDERLIDEVYAFVAPKVIGGDAEAIGGAGLTAMRDALSLREANVRILEGDVLIHGRL
jgi:diaminohydroxyphosphoribosylaminopyrimidine deaminase/5-amino-6-(5-phosphoribosylamino)uracil reductase